MLSSYQPESLNLQNDDFALSKRALLGKEPFREVYSSDFVIVDNHFGMISKISKRRVNYLKQLTF